MRFTNRFLVLLALLLLPAAALAAPPQVDYTGTTWSGVALLRAKSSPGGSGKGFVDMNLDFGPQGDPSFEIGLDDGDTNLLLFGTWSLDTKGRPVLVLDTAGVEAEIHQLLADSCSDTFPAEICDVFDQVDVLIGPKDFKAKLKPKDQDGLIVVHASGKLRFGVFLDDRRLLRATFGFKSDLTED